MRGSMSDNGACINVKKSINNSDNSGDNTTARIIIIRITTTLIIMKTTIATVITTVRKIAITTIRQWKDNEYFQVIMIHCYKMITLSKTVLD